MLKNLEKQLKINLISYLLVVKITLRGKYLELGTWGYVNNRDIITVISAISRTLLDQGKITTKQAGEALEVASTYLEAN